MGTAKIPKWVVTRHLDIHFIEFVRETKRYFITESGAKWSKTHHNHALFFDTFEEARQAALSEATNRLNDALKVTARAHDLRDSLELETGYRVLARQKEAEERKRKELEEYAARRKAEGTAGKLLL